MGFPGARGHASSAKALQGPARRRRSRMRGGDRRTRRQLRRLAVGSPPTMGMVGGRKPLSRREGLSPWQATQSISRSTVELTPDTLHCRPEDPHGQDELRQQGTRRRSRQGWRTRPSLTSFCRSSYRRRRIEKGSTPSIGIRRSSHERIAFGVIPGRSAAETRDPVQVQGALPGQRTSRSCSARPRMTPGTTALGPVDDRVWHPVLHPSERAPSGRARGDPGARGPAFAMRRCIGGAQPPRN